jgi:Tfp pilus assembly protein PilO
MQEKIRLIIREEIRRIIGEEKGLTKKFDKVVTTYQSLTKQVQDEIKKFKTEFPTAKDKDAYKKQYIDKMKPLQKKLKEAEAQYNAALRNLPVPDDDELM